MGVYPQSAIQIATYHTPFASAGAAASGVRAALDIRGQKDINVVTFAGDGGTFDIGLQSLSGAAERNENIFYICYDNEAYMNTGIQRSSATPVGCWTTTTPQESLKDRPKKDIMEIMSAHSIPYAATASVAYLDDLRNKIAKGLKIFGTKFYHIISPCPVGWRFNSNLTIHLSRLAVETGLFPLYEITGGKVYTLNSISDRLIRVEDYLRLQGRFSFLTQETVQQIQTSVTEKWQQLLLKTEISARYSKEMLKIGRS